MNFSPSPQLKHLLVERVSGLLSSARLFFPIEEYMTERYLACVRSAETRGRPRRPLIAGSGAEHRFQ